MGRYSRWRRRDDEVRQVHDDDGVPYRRLFCPTCDAWVLEVDEEGLVVAVRNRHLARPLTDDDDPYLVVGIEFRCAKCQTPLRWDGRDADTVQQGWVAGP